MWGPVLLRTYVSFQIKVTFFNLTWLSQKVVFKNVCVRFASEAKWPSSLAIEVQWICAAIKISLGVNALFSNFHIYVISKIFVTDQKPQAESSPTTKAWKMT